MARGVRQEVLAQTDLDYLGVKSPTWNISNQMHTKGHGMGVKQM